MTESEIAEVQRRARQDAQAQQSGWPVKANPFSNYEKATEYQKAFDAAAKELKEQRR